MIQRTYLVFIVIILTINISFAQEKKSFKNDFGISTGYNFGAYKNLTLSPVSHYNYNSALFFINYLRNTKKNRIVSFQFQHLKSELQSERISALNLNYVTDQLDIQCLYPIINQNNWALHIGFLIQNIGVEFGNLIAGEFQQKVSLANRISFGINDKNIISSQLSIPTLFFVFGNLDRSIYIFNEYQGYIFNVKYHYLLSNRFSIVSEFRSRYDRIQSNNVVRELRNTIFLGVNYKF